MVENTNKPKDLTNMVIGGIVVAMIIAGVVGAINGNKSNNSDTENNVANNNLFTEEEIESFCQEDYLVNINSYFKSIGVNYAMINVWNYNKYFNAEYQRTRDEAKDPIALLSWNGKNKDTGDIISFMCWATKKDGQKKLLLLETSGQTIQGDASSIYGE